MLAVGLWLPVPPSSPELVGSEKLGNSPEGPQQGPDRAQTPTSPGSLKAPQGWGKHGAGRSRHAQVRQPPVLGQSNQQQGLLSPLHSWLLATMGPSQARSLGPPLPSPKPGSSDPSATPCQGTHSGISWSGQARKFYLLWRTFPGLPWSPLDEPAAQR